MHTGPHNPLRATLIGGTAVLMWATLALFTELSGDVPPFQLTAMAFLSNDTILNQLCRLEFFLIDIPQIRFNLRNGIQNVLEVNAIITFHR